LAVVRPSGAPLPAVNLGSFKIEFYYMAVLALILNLLFFCLVALIRATYTRANKIISKVMNYLFHPKISSYWIYIILTYIAIVALCFIIYLLKEDLDILVFGIFIPIILIFSLNSILHYVEVGY